MFICCCAVRLTPKNSVVGQLVEKVDLNHAEDEPFELTKEIETQIIGNLLPDDDDLLSGVFGGVKCTRDPLTYEEVSVGSINFQSGFLGS